MHYVKSLNQHVVDDMDNEDLVFFHRMIRQFEQGEDILNRGNPTQITAKDLLWHPFRNYDPIGHTFWTWAIWHAVVGHPRVKSAVYRVGGQPLRDKAVQDNNELLSQTKGPFSAEFIGGYGPPDGYVCPKPKAGFRSLNIPLEVGHVLPETLYTHIRENRSFARWPIGYPFVYVFEIPLDCGKIGPEDPWRKGMFSIWNLLKEHLVECNTCSSTSKSVV
jgi:hypothetical protein